MDLRLDWPLHLGRKRPIGQRSRLCVPIRSGPFVPGRPRSVVSAMGRPAAQRRRRYPSRTRLGLAQGRNVGGQGGGPATPLPTATARPTRVAGVRASGGPNDHSCRWRHTWERPRPPPPLPPWFSRERSGVTVDAYDGQAQACTTLGVAIDSSRPQDLGGRYAGTGPKSPRRRPQTRQPPLPLLAPPLNGGHHAPARGLIGMGGKG